MQHVPEASVIIWSDSEDSSKGNKTISKNLELPASTARKILKVNEHHTEANPQGQGQEAQDLPAVGVQTHAICKQQPQAYVQG